MLTAAGHRKRHKVRALVLSPRSSLLPAGEDPKDQETQNKEESDKLDAFADSEYGVYQGHLANMLMMATLLFGFCATGTFLAVSFTGEETSMTTEHLINLVRHSLHSTFASVMVTMLVFVFSARAAWQYQLFGAQAALQPIYKGMLFISGAEVLLYYSLISFVSSIEEFALMNYVGPNICPTTKFQSATGFQTTGDQGDDYRISSTSFCSRVGSDMFASAAILCGPPLEEPSRNARNRNATQPWLACTSYDSYVWYHGATKEDVFWFGWDIEKNWVDVEIIEDGVWALAREDLIDDADDYWQQEAFLDVVTRTSDHICGKSDLATTTLCQSGATVTAACVQARATYLQADACSGGKEADAVKCRKSCQTVRTEWGDGNETYGGTVTWASNKKTVKDLMSGTVWWIQLILWTVLVSRAIAGLVTTVKSLKSLCAQPGTCSWLWILDLPGIFDTCQPGLTARNQGDIGSEDDED